MIDSSSTPSTTDFPLASTGFGAHCQAQLATTSWFSDRGQDRVRDAHLSFALVATLASLLSTHPRSAHMCTISYISSYQHGFDTSLATFIMLTFSSFISSRYFTMPESLLLLSSIASAIHTSYISFSTTEKIYILESQLWQPNVSFELIRTLDFLPHSQRYAGENIP